ncbi:hypothetical protein L873DRAFT_1724762 [Choiromyces venosus 120613-1]|uniref:Uncharacterized protein n=1 Tax=Choiromyces venosus 120613-1 TaxID=1336337 RepID=A0A3N4J4J1_9PEZI|nr:hypothetical protein L873DRAFT_1724762 [Choiromyces venosus 120613-1]
MTLRPRLFSESMLTRGIISLRRSPELSVTCVPRAGSLLCGGDSTRISSMLLLACSPVGFARLCLGSFSPNFLRESSVDLLVTLHWEGLPWFASSIIIISKPQRGTWVTRLMKTPWSTARKTLPALACVTLLISLSTELVHGLASARVDGPTRVIALIATCLLFLGIVLPASVALTRVQASHLPEDIEPIVPFGRSFGKSDGRDLTFVEAWKSIGMNGWKRVARMFLKLAPMAVVLPVVFFFGAIFFVVTYVRIRF